MEISLTDFSYSIPIRGVQTLSTSPPIISLSGDEVSKARTVHVNDVEARFEVVSADRLLVEVPSTALNAGISSINITSSGPLAVTSSVAVSFSFKELSSTVSGISAVVQRFLKLLLTSKGTSYVNMSEGGDVLSMVALSDGDGLAKGILIDAVEGVERYMKDDPKFVQLPASERLHSAEVISAEWIRESQTASVTIRVTNQLGETVESGVSI